jgi:hypothetical protein
VKGAGFSSGGRSPQYHSPAVIRQNHALRDHFREHCISVIHERVKHRRSTVVEGRNHDNQAAPGSAAISFTNPARSECSPSS